ncbi:MAG: 7-cyano-7-deazaguanine synthase QueC [Halobacteriota archaeon]
MSTEQKRAVVLVSGGMDSATAVAEARELGFEPYFLHTSYGQKTQTKEHECARKLADEFGAVDFLHVETEHLAKIGASSLTDGQIVVVDTDFDSDDIPTSYVPFRNANLPSMAVSYAEAAECESVLIGAHSEDLSGYPDCRPAFFEAFQAVVDVGKKPETQITIEAPFAEWSKADIAERGLELGVPHEYTWSCYRAEEPACGTCDSCALRLEAFARAGAEDPIRYADRPGDA